MGNTALEIATASEAYLPHGEDRSKVEHAGARDFIRKGLETAAAPSTTPERQLHNHLTALAAGKGEISEDEQQQLEDLAEAVRRLGGQIPH